MPRRWSKLFDAGRHIKHFFNHLRHRTRLRNNSRSHATNSGPTPVVKLHPKTTTAALSASQHSLISNIPITTQTPSPLAIEPTPPGLSPPTIPPSRRPIIHTNVQPYQNNNIPSTCTRHGTGPSRESASNAQVDPVHETTPREPRSRALLIGVHYKNHVVKGWDTLVTPGTDVMRMRKLLRSRGYTEFRTLVDTKDPECHAMPTEDEIRKGLRWLIQDARSGDRLFLHYSGHGDQVPTDDTSESDGHNEAIVPLNLRGGEDTLIIDDELHKILVKPLPEGCTLLAVFDCCHSGTMLDLPQRFPQHLTRRNLKAKLIRDFKRRFVRPIREVRSVPHMRRPHRTLSPAPDSIAAQGDATKQPARKAKRGSMNPLQLPYIGGSWLPPDSITGHEPNGGGAGTGDHNDPLVPPARLLVDEPRGSMESRPSTAQSSMQMQMQIGAPPQQQHHHHHHHHHAVIIPSRGQSVETNWVPDASLTATPRNHVFFHDDGDDDGGQTVKDTPMVRDFVMHRAYTHIKSPTWDEEPAPRATIIAIAACLDEELAVDIENIGGLLTETFIKCMEGHSEGVPLGTMISYFNECFKSKVKQLHEACGEAVNGACPNPTCGIPLKAPEPLVTSSMKLMADAHINL